jgi:hypothetical protein
LGRLLLVQLLVAIVVAGTIGWFLATDWFPTMRKAIRRLPDTGAIRDRTLSTPRDTAKPLAETRHLCLVVDVGESGVASSLADLRIEFRKTNWALCAFAGRMTRPYPGPATIPFNRPDLESWWGAWQPMVFAIGAMAIVAGQFASWMLLATIGCPVAWLIAYFKDRQLTVGGAWKLAAAALMPGALLVSVGVVLYGLGILDLLRLLLLWIAHVPLGMVYLATAPFRLPRSVPKLKADPFATKEPEVKNPFSGPPP